MTQKVLLYTSTLADAEKEIKAAGGSIPLQLSDKVFVAALSDDFKIKNLKFSTTQKPDDLDENSSVMVRAWERAAKKISEKKLSPKDGKQYKADYKKYMFESNAQTAKLGVTPPPTSLSMTGKIAVGIVVISGPASDNVDISPQDYEKILSETMQGNDFMGSYCYEANISFYISGFYIPISVPPDPNLTCKPTVQDSYDCENVFRNPALLQLNCTPDYDGVIELVNRLIKANTTDWGYIVFFSRYPTSGPGYAYGVNAYMKYSSVQTPDYNPDQINEIYVHEVCHIFGAADEYSPCTCDDSGTYLTPNKNCVDCTSSFSPKVKCLMDFYEDQNLCNWSRGQIGWGYWNLPFVKISGNSTSHAPSIAASSSSLFIAYQAYNSSAMYTLQSTDGETWNNALLVSDCNTSSRPCLAISNDVLYMAWVDASSSCVTIASSSDNGNKWEKTETDYKTTKTVSLTILNKTMFLAWINEESKICVTSSADYGKTFSQYGVYLESSAGPSLTVFNNELYLARVDPDDSCIYISSSPENQIHWSDCKTNLETSFAPGLTAFNNRLYLAYKDQDTNTIYYGSSKDGKTWGEKFTIIENTPTDSSVSITPFKNNLYMAIRNKSSDSDNNLLMTNNFIPGAF